MRDQFPFAVARVTRRWRKMLDERLKDLGVTQARWSTMVYLQQGGEGLTQRELASLIQPLLRPSCQATKPTETPPISSRGSR